MPDLFADQTQLEADRVALRFRLEEQTRAMREAQKRYYRTRHTCDLDDSKAAERVVDQTLRRLEEVHRALA